MARTYIAHIWEYPHPLGQRGQSNFFYIHATAYSFSSFIFKPHAFAFMAFTQFPYIYLCFNAFYYIDTSVLLENIPLVKFIKTASGTLVVYFPQSHTWVYRWRVFGNFPPKFVGVLRPLNFNYAFFKALLIFCQCRALFSSVLFLKIIVNNVLYRCTINLSRHNYFLANKSLSFYRCLFVYVTKRTLQGGLKIWILFSRGNNNILLTRCARS